MEIKLVDLTTRSDAHGTREGKIVYQKLMDIVSTHYNETVFNISLKGIVGTDASFPRESILSVAKQYRDEGKWFFISGDITDDMLFNWECAAKFKEQPLILWNKGEYKILGPKAGAGMIDVVHLIMDKGHLTAADVADKLDLSVPNASSKLKKLTAKGYISRRERAAETGGIEFIYQAIK